MKPEPKFKAGDRVLRNTLGTDMTGTVIDVYNSAPDYLGNCIPLYFVQWDGAFSMKSGGGYMEIGLQLIEKRDKL